MIFKPDARAEVQDWLTPLQVEIVKVTPPTEQLEWFTQRAKALREAMGPRYLCHENNRVRRLDSASYRPHGVISGDVHSMQRAA